MYKEASRVLKKGGLLMVGFMNPWIYMYDADTVSYTHLIAAMGNIDNSLVEAARVDGATEFQVFWKIKWPSLLPTTLYIAIITTINSFQCFALIQLLTSGGPNYSTSTLMYYLYEKAFQLTEYGYANTIGVFLAVMIAIVSFAQFKILGNDVEY